MDSKRNISFCRDLLGHGVGLLLILATAAYAASVPAHFPFSSGETIHYDIKKLGLKVGAASLAFKGGVRLGAGEAVLIIFTANAPKFYDEEKIYLDPDTFLPLRIERDLDIFGQKENIIEYYSKTANTVRIVKKAKGKTTQRIIQRSGRLDNIYGFIYRYRYLGSFEVGEKLQIYLPTRDVVFELIATQDLDLVNKTFKTYYMESNPKKYRVWFDQGSQKIPLRIDGAVGFGKTAMVMRSYHQ